jgi:hypothetical protein
MLLNIILLCGKYTNVNKYNIDEILNHVMLQLLLVLVCPRFLVIVSTSTYIN